MLIDSNVVIYSSQRRYLDLRQYLHRITRSVSIISYIETLGYPRLNNDSQRGLEQFFQSVEILPLSNAVAQQAVELRQQRPMDLADAIVAATAITHNLTLITNNVRDFEWISQIELLDPFTNPPW